MTDTTGSAVDSVQSRARQSVLRLMASARELESRTATLSDADASKVVGVACACRQQLEEIRSEIDQHTKPFGVVTDEGDPT